MIGSLSNKVEGINPSARNYDPRQVQCADLGRLNRIKTTTFKLRAVCLIF